MDSPHTAADAAQAHGQDLAALRARLNLAGRRFVGAYEQEYGEAPSGSLLSSGVRKDLARLLTSSPMPSATGMEIEVHGEDCFRIWLPEVDWTVPLRSRPRLAPKPRLAEQTDNGQFSLFEEEDEGETGDDPSPNDMPPTPGDAVLFWRWEDGCVGRFSIARVRDLKNLGGFCEIVEEIEIGEAVIPLPSPVPSESNSDDDLDGLLSKRTAEEPMSEEELEDHATEESFDERGDTADGEPS